MRLEGKTIMSRLIKRFIAFLDPRPEPDFQQRMDESRRNAVKQSRDAIHETRRLRREVDSLYDRIVIDPPHRGGKRND